MSFETIIYGFIEGAQYNPNEFRKLQRLNLEVLAQLPIQDDYPYLSRSMFSAPGENYAEGTFRAQVIHFGSSQKGLEFEEIPHWIAKLESLLRKLYWYQTVAHIETEIDDSYLYRWQIGDDILKAFQSGDPRPTSEWTRTVMRGGVTIEG